MFIVLQIIVAWFYSHLLEYFLHKYVLHNPKRKKWFRTHFADHHRTSRRLAMIDPKYLGRPKWNGDPELKGLVVLGIFHLPLAFWFPVAYTVLIAGAINYYNLHSLSHQDIHWARKYLPWHYDHHIAPNQNANWGVRLPIIDYIFGSRIKHKGTKKEIIKYHFLKSRIEKTIKHHKRAKND